MPLLPQCSQIDVDASSADLIKLAMASLVGKGRMLNHPYRHAF